MGVCSVVDGGFQDEVKDMTGVKWYTSLDEIVEPIEEWARKKPPTYKEVRPRKPLAKWRASSIPQLCPREEALCTINDVIREDSIDVNLELIFTIGDGVHDAMQQRFLSDILIGGWRCKGCGKEFGSQDELVLTPESCSGKVWDSDSGELRPCPNHNYHEDVVTNWHLPGFEYMELTISQDEPFRIQSHPDGFIWRGDGPPPKSVSPTHKDVELLEIKSCSDAVFKFGGGKHKHGAKHEPLHVHLIQVMTYLKIMNMAKARIMYVNKSGYGVRSTIASHVVDFDEVFYKEHVEDPILSYEAAVAEGDPALASRVCSSKTCKRAKSCPVKDMCWSLVK